MHNGWVRIYRVLLDKHIWLNSTPEQKVILVTVLLMANHKPFKWEWKNKDYDVQPGQFITSINSIVEKCGKGISVQNVRTALKKFQRLEFLTIESTNENSLVTITNWELYQPNEDELTNGLTSGSQTTNKRLTTNKNDKNEKNEKNNKDTNVSMSIDEQSTQVNLSYEAIINFFNAKTNGVFGKVRYPISEKRKGMLRARIREHGKQAFAEVVLKAANSEFLKGNNSRGFQATFDWLIKPNNFQKTLEGNYDNRESIKYETNERDHATAKRHSEIAELTRVAIEEEERNNSNLW